MCGWCVVMRREFFETWGGYDERFVFWRSDVDLGITFSLEEGRRAPSTDRCRCGASARARAIDSSTEIEPASLCRAGFGHTLIAIHLVL
jgi:hypothetical protein